MENNEVVWRANTANQWGLYSNTDYKLPIIEDSPESHKEQQKPTNVQDSVFYFTKVRSDAKGTLVYTPKGYGIIQSAPNEKELVSVKIEGTIHEIEKHQVMHEIPIDLVIWRGSTKVDETMILPISTTIADVYNKAKYSMAGQNAEMTGEVKIYYKGKELERSTETLERLKVLPKTKFLVVQGSGKPLTIKRFPTINPGWYYDESSIDGVSITPNKNMLLKGFAVYRGEEGMRLNVEIKVLQGNNTNGAVLYHETVSLPLASEDPEEKIYKIWLNKPIKFNAEESFSITFTCKEGHSYYGSGGTTNMEGEGDISFTFKECSGAHNGTSATSGQIPELYYYK